MTISARSGTVRYGYIGRRRRPLAGFASMRKALDAAAGQGGSGSLDADDPADLTDLMDQR
jgi:hypothetical protein